MTGKENCKGNPISIVWDKEDGKDFIIIKDCEGNLIMKMDKELWKQEGFNGLTPTIRDSIIDKARRLYG